jgi:DNA-directed RNA polymerase subunit RPC12/RpoP
MQSLAFGTFLRCGSENLGAAIFLQMVHLKRPEDKYACSKCNSSHIDIYTIDGEKKISCLDCGHEEEYN